MKVKVAVLGFLSLTIFIASVDVKQHLKKNEIAVKSENCLLALRYSAINIPRTVFLVYISHGRAPMWTLAFTAWFTYMLLPRRHRSLSTNTLGKRHGPCCCEAPNAYSGDEQ